MGNEFFPYITENCFVVHSLDDVIKSEQWIEEDMLKKKYIKNGLIKNSYGK